MGTPRNEAELVVDVHVDSDLRGEESHGVRMLDIHLRRIKAGGNLAKSRVTVLKDRKAVALLDAHHSLGQVVAARAMEMAIAKAGEYGIGVVGVRNANSYTSAKYYPLMAADAGMIGKTYYQLRAHDAAPRRRPRPRRQQSPGHRRAGRRRVSADPRHGLHHRRGKGAPSRR